MLSLSHLVDDSIIDESWATVLEPLQPVLTDLGERLTAEQQAGRTVLPEPAYILRAFQRPFRDVRVLITGQDPYPTPGHPIGLSFAADRRVHPLPRSLVNIYKERESDVGIPPAPHADLTAWTEQGVLLLNRVLTVQAGSAGSHRGWGWEQVTEHAIRALAARDEPLVAVLWGKDAASLQTSLGETPSIVSAHPSPLSARNGFFGSRPFSRTNALLREQGAEEIDWHVGGEPESLLGAY